MILPIPGERHSFMSDALSFKIVTKSDVQRVSAIRTKIGRVFRNNMLDYQPMLCPELSQSAESFKPITCFTSDSQLYFKSVVISIFAEV